MARRSALVKPEKAARTAVSVRTPEALSPTTISHRNLKKLVSHDWVISETDFGAVGESEKMKVQAQVEIGRRE